IMQMRAFPGHDGLDKYAGHARCHAVDALDGRDVDEAISRPNKRAPTRRSARRLAPDGAAGGCDRTVNLRVPLRPNRGAATPGPDGRAYVALGRAHDAEPSSLPRGEQV